MIMEINDDAVFQELSPNQVRDLQLGMRHFFVNYPHEEVKRIIWELYRGWVFNSAEYVQQEEITDMLLFYEAILEFTGDVHSYCQYLGRTVLKSD
jgi:hypothetical protein